MKAAEKAPKAECPDGKDLLESCTIRLDLSVFVQVYEGI